MPPPADTPGVPSSPRPDRARDRRPTPADEAKAGALGRCAAAPEPASILLIEDSPEYARLVLALLEEEAGRPLLAPTLAEGLRALRLREFRAVLLDLSLPDSEGLATFQRVRDANPDVPIVVLTGLDDDALAMAALAAGAQDYLVKDNADRYALNRAVRYAVQRREADRAEAQRRALAEAVRGMERVLAVVGHELRTPLGAFGVLLESIIDGYPPGGQENALKMLSAQVTHMSETVTNVLEAARMDSGRARWRWSRVGLAEVVESAAGLVRPLLEPGVVLTTSTSPRGAAMPGDAEALRRLLINLLSNAARHTRTGRITVGADLVRRKGSEWARIEVADTGPGIPPDILEQLGRAFALNTGVVSACGTGGTGLGLSICRAIAAAHAGRIEADSDGQHGSRFTVWLRADLDAPAEMPGQSIDPLPRTEHAPLIDHPFIDAPLLPAPRPSRERRAAG